MHIGLSAVFDHLDFKVLEKVERMSYRVSNWNQLNMMSRYWVCKGAVLVNIKLKAKKWGYQVPVWVNFFDALVNFKVDAL